MSKNKIVIDLRRTPLTPEQTKDLHNALHKTVVSQLAKIPSPAAPAAPAKGGKAATKAAPRKGPAGVGPGEAMMAMAGPQTANLAVKITTTNPGDSSVTAILNDQTKTLNSSGTITFSNVQSRDIIEIQGKSLGTTTVTIDISADPTIMNFPPGKFNDNFLID